MSSTSGPGRMGRPGPEEGSLAQVRRGRAAAGRRVWVGAAVMVVGALLPVLASVLDGGGATALWLVSMPTCLAGASLAAVGLLRLRSLRSRLHEDWG